ncbi:10 kDa chaperonin, mitochondrial [Physcomitrium patens]|uniref:Protein groES n=1 Tax=Physcomitrium patens TaxID=3218 RepID=A0A2K1KLZ8_PHYPA|nr:10 kDa chaperonin, mitochondrial-like [Physcomitrium patens]PNR54805.1 hypothetical protein PHYPA_005698 [Physcomitrium patens]|eukprot:XP_024374181.1 10 kDa chaperonin, mitochondrial-like [Physcomitrella patens]
MAQLMSVARRLKPLLDRVLVEKAVTPTVSAGGILLPETTTKVNSGVVVATGPGSKTKDGTLIPCDVKNGDTVLLPEYGGTPVKLEGHEGKEFLLYRNDDILGVLED